MFYTQNQLEYIRKNRPELNLKPVPKLDDVIVEFLKKFDVFVKPITSESKNTRDNIMGGVVTGLAGVDAGGDVFIASGQEKQTKVQEWIQWKQWALSHKDFEAYKAEKIDKVKAFNKSVEDKLRDPEFQKELEPLIKGFKDDLRTNRQKEEEQTTTIGLVAIVLIVGVLSVFSLINQNESQNDNRSSYLPRNLVI
tara:strand:- start:46 stop:630 length:585 start_codon:yes stop_codon:yes gene_type:complete